LQLAALGVLYRGPLELNGGKAMRGPARLLAEFAVRYGSKDEMLVGKGTDLSEKGIGFTGSKIFPPGTSLAIEFHIDAAGAE